MIHDARKHLLLANPGLDRKTFLLLGREGSMVLTHRQGSSFLHVAVPRSVRLDILSRDAKIYSGWGLERALSLAASGNTRHVAVSAKMGALESADIGASFTFPGPGTGITQGGCYTCLLPAMNQRGPGGAWCGNSTWLSWLLLTSTPVESPVKGSSPTWRWKCLFSAALATDSKRWG